MTSSEYTQWLTRLGRTFPSIDAYFRADGESKAVPKQRKADWYEVLAGIDLADAQAAIRRFLAGNPSLPYASEVPAAVITIAAELRAERQRQRPKRRYHDGEEAYRCLLCQDEGRLLVWHPQTVADVSRAGSIEGMARQYRGRPILYACSVACSCPAGESHCKPGKLMPHGSLRFSPDRHCVLEWIEADGHAVPPSVSAPEQQQRLLDWMADPTRQPNYETAFDSPPPTDDVTRLCQQALPNTV